MRRLIALLLLIIAAFPAHAAERWLHGDAAYSAFKRGDYLAARQALEAELARCEAARPKADECLDLLVALSNVAGLNGDVHDGGKVGLRALFLAKRTLPPDHEDIATILNNVAVLVDADGRYSQAERLYRQALAMKERNPATSGPAFASAYNNLALNLDAQGRHDEAEPLYRKALDLLPPDYPETASTLGNVGSNLDAQGEYAEAENFYRRALALRERLLPPDHPDIGTSINNLATNLDEQGRYEAAEPLYRKALAINLRALRENHPKIAACYYNLGANLSFQRQYRQAEPLFRKAMAISLLLPSTSHPDRIFAYLGLAENLSDQSRNPAEARTLYRKAERGVHRRMASFRDFGPAAQREIRKYRPIFTGQVEVAWRLAQQAGR